MTPIGSLALIFADPIVLRWVISVLVLVLLAVLASGWRYHGAPDVAGDGGGRRGRRGSAAARCRSRVRR